jgi:DNA repair protein RadC
LVNLAAAQQFFEDWRVFSDPERETLWIVHVNVTGKCLHFSEFVGDPCSVAFPIREVLSDALECGSAGLLIAHNHPSGDPRPSESDCRLTRQIATVGEAIDCRVLDHLIFAGTACISFREMGLL